MNSPKTERDWFKWTVSIATPLIFGVLLHINNRMDKFFEAVSELKQQQTKTQTMVEDNRQTADRSHTDHEQRITYLEHHVFTKPDEIKLKSPSR